MSEIKKKQRDTASEKSEEEIPDRVIARSYPSTIYLWPSILLGYVMYMLDIVIALDAKSLSILASIWLGTIVFNLIVISFDFSLGKTFTIFVTAGFLVLLYILVRDWLNIQIPLLPSIADFVTSLNISINPNFYLLFSLLITGIYLIVFVQTRFEYWEFTSNRITHHRGFFEREESFSAQNSRVVTETTDIFERLLFRAGMIYVIDGEGQIHKIRNVYDASGKDDKIQDMLSVVNVRHDE